MGQGTKIQDWSTPLSPGMESEHTLTWNRYDTLFYVALRAISRSGQSGQWSNIVSVYMAYPSSSTTEINTRGSTQAGATGKSPSVLGPALYDEPKTNFSTIDIFMIVGAASGVIIIVAIVAGYLTCMSRKRRQQSKKVKDTLDSVTIAVPPHDPESETDSINKQPAESMAMTETPSIGQRPLSPVQSWTASKLLAEHEKRCPSEAGVGNEIPDLGVPYHPHTFYYHTPNGNYIEDTIPIDSGSMISTQPSDSLLVYKVDSSTTESLRPASSPPAANTPISWDASRMRPMMNKVPPPTLPKPSVTVPLDLCAGNTGTLGHERRRRNVTQV